LFDSEEEDFEELADEEKLDLAKRNHELIKNTKSLSVIFFFRQFLNKIG
jgi:hypothetical protein